MIRVFICILVIIILIIILSIVKKKKIIEKMTESVIVEIISPYWNQYRPTDKRSKCFDCDKAENY